ncbi:MAG: S9 family peptidase, partial [Anaerolineae bacterium]|nr:S9 family peptidase [Anaerolineae bacterium]
MTSSRSTETPAWIQRFRAPSVDWTQHAAANPQRGILASNESGIFQLYAWDTVNNSTRQVTLSDEGTLFGFISPDGRYVFYFEDESGNEIGHWLRVPFAGGDPELATPTLDNYNRLPLRFSTDGRGMAVTTTSPAGFSVTFFPLDADG